MQRSHKADLKRLTLHLSKGETMVMRQRSENAEELEPFCGHFGLDYRGQGLSTCAELCLRQLLKQKRRAPTHEERAEVYRRQDGKCECCSC